MQQFPFNNLYQIVECNANEAPSKTLLYEEELKISNKRFKKDVDCLAAFLQQSGVRVGDRVGLLMSNSWQFIVNVFAISKLGAVVVPINNFLKEDEIAYILNDSQTSLLFISAKFVDQAKDLLGKTNVNKIIWVEGCPIENERNIDYSKIFAHPRVVTDAYAATLEDTAVIIYTSGTTGKPKGAMLSFKNIFSNCAGSLHLMGAKKRQLPMICYLPMFHAFTFTANMILPIYTQSSIVVVKSISTKKDFKYLLKQLLLKRCPYFTGVPEIYNAMAKADLPWYFHWFHNVKGFISGAAPLSDEVSLKFAKSFKRGVLLQGYGISECSPIVSCNNPSENRIGSVGRPLAGYQVKIFDEQMHELPVGEMGEICVKGDCVMQGYYNRQRETAEAIIDGWFKTGDMGKIDADGYIFIMDRKKDLIIHKGMNIYPREIEEVLYTHEKINACAVVAMKDKECGEVPIAFIELRENETSTEQEIKDFLKPHIAVFKMPRKVIFMDKLPRNATGKILKRELRELNT